MKKFWVLLIVCALCITGCGKNDNNTNNSTNNNTNANTSGNTLKNETNNNQQSENTTKNLFCSMKLDDEMNQDVNIKFDSNDQVLNVSTTIRIDLTSTLNGAELDDEMKQVLLDTYEKMFSEENGYKNAHVSFAGNVVIVSVDMLDSFDDGDLTGYNVAKHAFEELGYTCQ